MCLVFARVKKAWWMVHQVKQEGLEEMDLKPVVVFVNTRGLSLVVGLDVQ